MKTALIKVTSDQNTCRVRRVNSLSSSQWMSQPHVRQLTNSPCFEIPSSGGCWKRTPTSPRPTSSVYSVSCWHLFLTSKDGVPLVFLALFFGHTLPLTPKPDDFLRLLGFRSPLQVSGSQNHIQILPLSPRLHFQWPVPYLFLLVSKIMARIQRLISPPNHLPERQHPWPPDSGFHLWFLSLLHSRNFMFLCNSGPAFDFNLSVSLPEKPSLSSQAGLAVPTAIICFESHTFSSAAVQYYPEECSNWLCPVSSLSCGIRKALFLLPPTPKRSLTWPTTLHVVWSMYAYPVFSYNFSTQRGAWTSSMDVTGELVGNADF